MKAYLCIVVIGAALVGNWAAAEVDLPKPRFRDSEAILEESLKRIQAAERRERETNFIKALRNTQSDGIKLSNNDLLMVLVTKTHAGNFMVAADRGELYTAKFDEAIFNKINGAIEKSPTKVVPVRIKHPHGEITIRVGRDHRTKFSATSMSVEFARVFGDEGAPVEIELGLPTVWERLAMYAWMHENLVDYPSRLRKLAYYYKHEPGMKPERIEAGLKEARDFAVESLNALEKGSDAYGLLKREAEFQLEVLNLQDKLGFLTPNQP